MATIVDALVITLGLDTKGVKEGMAQAETTISSGVKNIVGNVLAPLAGAFAFGSMVKGYLSAADAVGKLSGSLDLNAEDMQAWGEAAARAGGSTDAFYSSLSSVSDKVTELARFGSGGAGVVLAQLGISARDANGQIKNSIQIMEDLAAASSRFGKTEFSAIAKKLGIDEGTIRLLRQGKDAVGLLVERQKALGVYTKEDAEIAAKANGAISDLIQSFKAISADILRIVVPALTWLSEKVTGLVTFMREHKAFIVSLLGAIAGALTGLLLPAIARVGAAMLANPLTWVFLGIAAAVLAVAAVIEDLYVYIKGGQSALEGFWSVFGSGQEIAAALSKAWAAFKDGLSYIFDMVKSGAPYLLAVLKSIFTIVGSLAGVLGSIFGYIKSIFSLDGAGMEKALRGMGAAAGSLLDGIDGLVLSLLDFVGLKEPILEAWGSVKDFFVDFLAWLFDKIDGILNFPGKIKDGIGGFFGGIGEGIAGFLGFGGGDSASLAPVTAAEALSPSVVNGGSSSSIQSESHITVGSVTVQTQATDAKGIAAAIPGAISDSFSQSLVLAANTGVRQK